MLTDKEISRAKSREKAYRLIDDRGLFLWITPAGGKLWRWKFRHEGKEKIMSYGQYPYVSPSDARNLHQDARRLHATGIDPMAKRKAEKEVRKATAKNSFQTVAGLWLEHWREGKSPRHADTVRRRMETDILPGLGARPIAEIEAPELVALVKLIEQRAPDLAKRALETMGQVFRFAIAHDYAKRNPASEIRPSDILKTTKTVNFARVDRRELPDLLRAIEVYRGTQVTRLAMKMMALTFVRTRELIESKWSEFDIEAARWKIPAERMKMDDPHIVPLAKQTLEVLEMLHTLTGASEWVFPGDGNPSKPMSNNTILKALERMGYKGKMTGHGFRGVASTILHEEGFEHDHIEIQLAHTERDEVSGAYNYALYLEPRTRMMQDWADLLDKTRRSPSSPSRPPVGTCTA